ncbi:LANO_0H08306g1_1 [Lachancea nothofagi CBS 11611]|uniref:LANO_0H08306g1_1 n=1 Tax=Lachancea nothofagi CBS 11611 TaxID=1266666 RepID=A0A1G4KM69_9SACH|nr:LANO_0H08306g1_1 [Lachancea nothofagi CBS 11611]
MYGAAAKWLRVFMKSYINVILYYRNVYPKESFDWMSFQAFNLPRHLPMNRHPELQTYIENLISDVLLKLDSIRHFNLRIVKLDDGTCVERYALDFNEFRHEEVSDLLETQVFDELRSSLNSLIARLENLPQIKPASVSFEIVIDSMGLSLGHKMNRVQNSKERQIQEQDSNWVKCSEEGFSANAQSLSTQPRNPRIKIISLTGCDIGPLVIFQFMEILISPTHTTSSQVYESSDAYHSSQSDPFP